MLDRKSEIGELWTSPLLAFEVAHGTRRVICPMP